MTLSPQSSQLAESVGSAETSEATQVTHAVQRATRKTALRFSCHPDVPCFTDCCRMLELALTPYDVLRLRYGTGLSSQELLDNYIIIEKNPDQPFPSFYLTMVDDGRASCVFVAKEGCKVYEHRPAACRAYPVGRAALRRGKNNVEEHFVILREEHCKGFREEETLSVDSYLTGQGLRQYSDFNDQFALILQHQAIRDGFQPSASQIDFFTLALYNLDTFRKQLVAGTLTQYNEKARTFSKEQLEDDEQLLMLGLSTVTDLFPL